MKLVTRDDVLIEHRNGAKEILVDKHTVITSWARDAAESFDMRFVTELSKEDRGVRRFIIAGNWKMNLTMHEAQNLVQQLRNIRLLESREMVLCVPFVYLTLLKSILTGSDIRIGAQNLSCEDAGAYTGEVSAKMLQSIGTEYVIAGHSERRNIFKEDDSVINRKMKKALEYNLAAILCVGEHLEERSRYMHFNVVRTQLEKGLADVTPEQMAKVVIAYEPVCAIGTGQTATPEQAQEMHGFIRNKISQMFDKKIAAETKILYGGSVKAENVDSLMSQYDIDGALVGGASLKFEQFERIYNFKVR